MLRCVWQTLNPLSIHVTFTAIVPGAYPREAKMCKNVLKWRTFELMGWITGKRLKIDGYMLRCVWQALNPLFIHLPRLSQGRTRQGGQNVQKCAKMANVWTYGLIYWETVEDRWVHVCCDALDKHWILFSSMWHLPRLSQGRTRGGQNVSYTLLR